MNHAHIALTAALLCSASFAQNIAIFPDEYSAVADGPFNSPNRPLSGGTSRVLQVYEAADLAIPLGRSISRIGFREDVATSGIDLGRTLQLEIRMGYTTANTTTLTGTYASAYATPPTTVLPNSQVVLPNLRDTGAPLPNGRLWIQLATPFVYNPPAGQNLVVEYQIFGNSGGGTPWNYRIDRADFYSPVSSGPAGCPHSGGQTPILTDTGFRPGQSFSASVTRAPGNSFALLILTPGAPLVAPYPLGGFLNGISPACTGQVSLSNPSVLTAFTSGTGGVSFAFQVPNNPIYNDMDIGNQGVFFDVFAPGGAVVSNGAQVKVGVNPRTALIYAAGPPQNITTGTVTRNYCPVTFFDHN
jgi:hypothetical protein